MRMKIMIGFILMAICVGGCSRTQQVRATQTGSGLPYTSLGTLEVKETAGLITGPQTFWSGVKVLSLGLADTPRRSTLYEKTLKQRLEKLSRLTYDADAVINVRYWPDLESSSFPDGLIYARGEMIRYKRFPQESSSEPLA